MAELHVRTCTECKRPLLMIDYYGQRLQGCTSCCEDLDHAIRSGCCCDWTTEAFPEISRAGLLRAIGGGPDVRLRFGVPRTWRKPLLEQQRLTCPLWRARRPHQPGVRKRAVSRCQEKKRAPPPGEEKERRQSGKRGTFSMSGSFLDAKGTQLVVVPDRQGLAMVAALEIERLVLGGVDMSRLTWVQADPNARCYVGIGVVPIPDHCLDSAVTTAGNVERYDAHRIYAQRAWLSVWETRVWAQHTWV